MESTSSDFDTKAFANWVVMRDFPFQLLKDYSETPPFIASLDESLARIATDRKLLLPNLQLHTKTVLVFSDYSGESADSLYSTYSFFFTSYDAHKPILDKLQDLRKRNGLNEPFKEFCFKDSGYGPINRTIKDWLNTADNAVGLLFTLIVDKNVACLFGNNHRGSQRELVSMIEEEGLGKWKPAVAEKLLRVIHVISYWLAALSSAEQNVCWMTDHDAIVANTQSVESMQRMLSGVMNGYLQRTGKIITALPFDKELDKYGFSDFLSIPDLVAGSVESLFTRSDKMSEPTIRSQANEVLLWLCRQGIGLKKLTMTIKQADGGQIQTSITRFEPNDGHAEGECVLITL